MHLVSFQLLKVLRYLLRRVFLQLQRLLVGTRRVGVLIPFLFGLWDPVLLPSFGGPLQLMFGRNTWRGRNLTLILRVLRRFCLRTRYLCYLLLISLFTLLFYFGLLELFLRQLQVVGTLRKREKFNPLR